MDTKRFELALMALVQSRSRREAVRHLAAGVVGLGGAGLLAASSPARRRKRNKRKRNKGGKGGKGGGGGGGNLGLREICDPANDACQAGLTCDSPTTRHTCSSTVEGIDAWCCVPPGGRCTECDCCGDFYCAFDDDNNPSCQPNPEG